ncbi:hypothetical protein [Natrialba asiatica]|uniref:Uncharacterized protein n=1 Tax=Natrialba asiatica (strain ATCC 700177 / DSM 12278 / JCM 9576 / FERM P-10747 / NBRC 102637 / 172P1) TaxID=29540 RepID=M0B0X2_NATA1|nr:hypothetical protein [Natrialba asiatica]ELZ03883.1 hypothetical protein C481_04873 [Natrialba asiatica DSM 12278]
MQLDPDRLENRLHDEFSATEPQVRIVVRQAVDLAEAGQYEADVGAAVTAGLVVAELGDAPSGTVPERWNWWMGSLELAFGGYERFSIQRYRT